MLPKKTVLAKATMELPWKGTPVTVGCNEASYIHVDVYIIIYMFLNEMYNIQH